MTENPETGILSIEEAANVLMEPAEATPETEENAEPETEPTTAEVEDAEDIVEEEHSDDQAEAESEEVEEDEAQEEDEEDADPIVHVKLDGKDVEVPLSEALKGYQRQADYTRKTTEVAEERKELQREKAETQNLKAQLTDALAQMSVPSEQPPNWEVLAAQLSPQEYNQQRAQWDAHEARRQQAEQAYHALRQQQFEEVRSREMDLLFQKLPELRDSTAYAETSKALLGIGQEYDFSADELSGMTDHRFVVVLNDLRKFKEMTSNANAVAKKVAKATPALKAGKATTKAKKSAKARQDARNRLQKSGSVHDAVNLILDG